MEISAEKSKTLVVGETPETLSTRVRLRIPKDLWRELDLPLFLNKRERAKSEGSSVRRHPF